MVGVGVLIVLLVVWLAWKWWEHQNFLREVSTPSGVPGWPAVTPKRARELHVMRYRDYMDTPEWTQRAIVVKEQAGWRCTFCRSDTRLQAHHLTYRRRGYERPADLLVLCRDCHQRVHGTTRGIDGT